MGTIATVKIVNKRNGKTRIINENEWAHDLGRGKYDGWQRAGSETHGDADEAARINIEEEAARAKAIADAEQAAADAQNAENEAQRAAENEAAAAAADDADESTDDDGTLTMGESDDELLG